MLVPIFLINMDRDTQRLAHMAAELSKAGVPFERVAAISGRDLPPPWAKRFPDARPDRSAKLKPGEVGCFASHLNVIQLVVDRNLPAALVLEDDLVLPSDFRGTLTSLLANLPAGWDIVRLSNPPKRTYVALCRLAGECELVRYSKIPNNTGAYLISAAGARKFLARAVGRRPIDEELRRPWLYGMNTYGVVPPPVVSNIFDSSIDRLGTRKLGAGRSRIKMLSGRTEGPLGALGRASYNISVLGASDWTRCALRNAMNTFNRRGSQRPLHLRIEAAGRRKKSPGPDVDG